MINRQLYSIRWFFLIVGVVSLLFIGVIYAWSILKSPLAAEFGWNTADLSLNFTLTMSFFCLGGVAGSVLSRKAGVKITLLAAAVLTGSGFILCAYLSGRNIGMLYLFYGICSGFGIGIAYNIIISTINAWFPEKKGMCAGCLMMGFGSSALIFGSLIDQLFRNPDIGWRFTYLLLGLSEGIVLFIASMTLRLPPAAVKFTDLKSINDKSTVKNRREYNPSEMIRQDAFWKAFVYNIFLASVGSSVISFAKDISLSVGANARLSTVLVGVLSVCNGLGRMFFGAFFDWAGWRKTMLLTNLVTIVAAMMILFSIFNSSLWICIIGMCVTGISYGSCPTVSSAFTADFYGLKFFPINFSIMSFNIMFASFIATIANLLYSHTNSYLTPFILLTTLSVVALFLNISIRGRKCVF